MIRLPRVIEALVDAPSVDLAAVADVLSTAEPSLTGFELDRLIELARRLPIGIAHAEAIWAVSEAPKDVAPLATGSRWHALDRTLLCVLEPGQAALQQLVGDLACYALLAWQVHERLHGADALFAALVEPGPLDTTAAAQLALRFDTTADVVQALDVRAPGLRGDLAALGRGPFAPEVHLHGSVRPAQAIARGAAIGDAVVAEVGPRPMWLLVSDGYAMIEHLSPYVRDLGHALTTWGRENAASLSTAGLAEALDEAAAAPEADLSSLVARDLIASHPELVEERRGNERTVGLHLDDRAGTVFGRCELSALEDVDVALAEAPVEGVLVVLAGGAHETLVEAARRILDAGQVTAIAATFETSGPAAPVVVADALVTEGDAIALSDATVVAQVAQELEIDVMRVRALPVDGSGGAPPALLQLLRLVRRSVVCRDMPVEGRCAVVLSARPRPGSAPDLGCRLGPLQAARVALAALSAEKKAPPRSDRPKGKSVKSARFRV